MYEIKLGLKKQMGSPVGKWLERLDLRYRVRSRLKHPVVKQ